MISRMYISSYCFLLSLLCILHSAFVHSSSDEPATNSTTKIINLNDLELAELSLDTEESEWYLRDDCRSPRHAALLPTKTLPPIKDKNEKEKEKEGIPIEGTASNSEGKHAKRQRKERYSSPLPINEVVKPTKPARASAPNSPCFLTEKMEQKSRGKSSVKPIKK